MAARAWQALFHINPWRERDPELLDEALVGGLLLNELLHNSRGLVDKPMTVQFVTTLQPVQPYRLDGAKTAAELAEVLRRDLAERRAEVVPSDVVLAADRTGRIDGGEPAA